jgi:hypothetical protein
MLFQFATSSALASVPVRANSVYAMTAAFMFIAFIFTVFIYSSFLIVDTVLVRPIATLQKLRGGKYRHKGRRALISISIPLSH